jgi:hypothetical protein
MTTRTVDEIDAERSAIQTEWVDTIEARNKLSEKAELLAYKKNKLMDELLEALQAELAKRDQSP